MVQLEKKANSVFMKMESIRSLFFLGKPAVVRASEINLMQDNLNGVYNDVKVTSLSMGQFHTIKEGPFSGFTGEVVRTDNTKVKLEIRSLDDEPFEDLKNRQLKMI